MPLGRVLRKVPFSNSRLLRLKDFVVTGTGVSQAGAVRVTLLGAKYNWFFYGWAIFWLGGVTCSSAWLVILRTLVQELLLWSWFVRRWDAGNCVVLSLDVARFAPAVCVLGRVLRASPLFKF